MKWEPLWKRVRWPCPDNGGWTASLRPVNKNFLWDMNSTKSVKPPRQNDPSSQKLLALHVFTLRSYTLPTTMVIEFYSQAYPYNLHIVMRSRDSNILRFAKWALFILYRTALSLVWITRFRECENNRKITSLPCTYLSWTPFAIYLLSPWPGLRPGLKIMDNNAFAPCQLFTCPSLEPGLKN